VIRRRSVTFCIAAVRCGVERVEFYQKATTARSMTIFVLVSPVEALHVFSRSKADKALFAIVRAFRY
jgi:hypothetical protein